MLRCGIATLAILLGFAAGTARAAVQPARLTLSVRSFPLVCGRMSGSLQIPLPRAFDVPPTIAAGEVRLNGADAGHVVVRGHTVILAAAAHHGVTCNVVVAARLTVVFTKAAGIGAPATGRYRVTVWHAKHAYHATLVVSR